VGGGAPDRNRLGTWPPDRLNTAFIDRLSGCHLLHRAAAARKESVMRLHSDDFADESEGGDPERRAQPERFAHRHGLKVLGAIMATAFTMVMVVQVAC